jgi:uncharacterized membrane protein
VKLHHVRPAKTAQARRGPIWLWPTLSGFAAFAVTTALTHVPTPEPWGQLLWPGDTDSASTLTQVVAASVITVTTLTFSLTVLALQLASQQFSPRLLREFTRDPVTRVVLSVLVATFVAALTVVRHLRADAPVPRLGVLLVMVGGLASLAALLAFITHIVRVLRVDTMMLAVHDETHAAICTFYPPYGDERPRDPDAGAAPPGQARVVAASRSGFVQVVDVSGLVSAAHEQRCMVQLMVRPGDHAVRGSLLALFWDDPGSEATESDTVSQLIHETVRFGYERTLEQDAAFGFRQLADVAVKALSPGINDPVTAAHAIGHMADLIVQLLGCRLGPTVHLDDAGVPRAIVPDRDIAYYLELACGQVRRYGRHEPTVLNSLLRMLRDAATAARDEQHRQAIDTESRLITEAASDSLLPEEKESILDMAERVRKCLAGDRLAAYSDRAGETRSI